jgi:hypothetical protein
MKMAVTKTEAGPVNRLDEKMTPGQVARRRFKSTLPRKTVHRELSPMRALGELFTLLDQFRGFVMAEKKSEKAAQNVYAALAYVLPNEAKLAFTLAVPEPGGNAIAEFCNEVLDLHAQFLGVVFVQVDPDAAGTKYQAISFVVPFMSGPDAEARLMYAQKEEMAKIQRTVAAVRTIN